MHPLVQCIKFLQIALAVEQAEKQDKFNQSLYTRFEKSEGQRHSPRGARTQETVVRGKLLTPKRVPERMVSNIRSTIKDFISPGTHRLEKR